MKKPLPIAACLLGLALYTGPALAQVYTWVDKDGTVHYSAERPPADQPTGKVRSIDVEPSDAEPPADAGEAGTTPPQGTGAAKAQAKPKKTPTVVLYTTNWCPYCKKAREYFSSRGIPFTEHDIEGEAGAMERKLGLDGDKRVPTAVIGGKVVRGYAPAKYQAALEQP